MKRSTQDAEALLESLVLASRTTPTAQQAKQLEQRLAPWLDPRPSALSRGWRMASTIAIIIASVGVLSQVHGGSAGVPQDREGRSWTASPRVSFVRHEPPTAPERLVVDAPIPIATPTQAVHQRPYTPADEPSRVPAVVDRVPEEQEVPRPAPSSASREPEVDFLRRAQGLLASSPSDALSMADEHPALYPRGVLVQEREVIAIDALVRLGRRAEAAARAAAFRAAFPRSAHSSRVTALTEKH